MKLASLSIMLLATVFCLVSTFSAAAQDSPAKALVGNWVCQDDGTKVQIRGNGTLTINDAEFAYRVKGSVINVVGDEGSMSIPFQLDGDTLTVDVEGREMVYVRAKAGSASAKSSSPSAGGVMQALVGKWCYMSNLTGSNSRMSNRCFVLNGNGTYEYSSETSSSGAYGGTSSQEYDSGRWTATRTSITAMSNTNGRTVYPIELRNHPKTGDPMIVVDGDAYVTAYQRAPW
jgi:hypothetical protein